MTHGSYLRGGSFVQFALYQNEKLVTQGLDRCALLNKDRIKNGLLGLHVNSLIKYCFSTLSLLYISLTPERSIRVSTCFQWCWSTLPCTPCPELYSYAQYP